MKLYRLAALLLPAILLAGCATTNATSPTLAESTTPYGDYLAGRYAAQEAQMELATRYFQRAMQKEAGNAELRQRSMLTAVYAGDMRAAGRLAQVVMAADDDSKLAPVFAAEDLMARSNYAEAQKILDGVTPGPLNKLAITYLQGWNLAQLGKQQAAMAKFEALSDMPNLPELGPFSEGLLYWQKGDLPKAEAAFRKAYDTKVLMNRTLLALGAVLIREDKGEEARTLARAHLVDNPNEAEAKTVLHWLDTGATPDNPFPTPKVAAAEGLRAMAQLWATRGLLDLGVLYVQMAVDMDPGNDATRLLAGQMFELQNREDDALNMYASIKADSALYEDARLQMSRAYMRDEQNAKAVSLLADLVQSDPSRRAREAWGQALQYDKQYDKAFAVFDALIREDPKASGWLLYFNRGVTLERTGKWKQSLPDFEEALKKEPDQADVLNYLGYTMVDNGDDVDKGFALIQKAIQLDPEAGYIVDSLGWGHYKLGQYDKAVKELERAVELEPGEPAINDHLGDAYWKVGRKLEARYQWQRVLSLDPEPGDDVDVAQVKAKIAGGLDAAKATPAPAPEADKAHNGT